MRLKMKKQGKNASRVPVRLLSRYIKRHDNFHLDYSDKVEFLLKGIEFHNSLMILDMAGENL